MRNDKHLSDESLNAYLDDELSATERDSAEAHLATCEVCRAELQALKALFAALDTVTDIPAPNLVSGVLTRVQSRHRSTALHWLIPAFQAVIAAALLAWGWTRLVSYWTAVANALPTEALSETGKQMGEWVVAQRTALSALPNATWRSVQGLITHLTPATSLGPPLPQLVMVGVVVGILWLACNVTLLRRSLLNGHKTQN